MKKQFLAISTLYLCNTWHSGNAQTLQLEAAPYVRQQTHTARKLIQPQLRAPNNAGTTIHLGSARTLLKKALARKPSGDFHTRAEQVGIARAVPEPSSLLAWQSFNGGQIATVTINSEAALGLSLGIQIERLPLAAELRFFSADSANHNVYLVSGAEILTTIYHNLSSDSAAQAKTYWSPIIDGSTVGVEIYLPPGITTDSVALRIPNVSHVFKTDKQIDPIAYSLKRSAFCELDYTCDAATWPVGSAVARMQFVDAGNAYVCTGTLLNNRLNSQQTSTPYFISANHCIATQTVASTLRTTWFYQSAACNSSSQNSNAIMRQKGATLLYTNNTFDTSFFKLNEDAPSGAMLAGWKASTEVLGQSGTGIHHPQGDLKKISQGNTRTFVTCDIGTSTDGSFSCRSSTNTSHIDIPWIRGITEGGSSGSGLFLNNGYLIGVLSGGSSGCFTQGSDVYGRFDLAYNDKLHTWLDPAVTVPTTPEEVNKTPFRNNEKVINYALLQMNTPSTVPVSVDFETLDDTAKAGIDYTAAQGIATIPAGEVSVAIPLEILPSNATEDRIFYLRVFNPKGANFPPGVNELKVARTIKSPQLTTRSEQQLRKLQGLWRFAANNNTVEGYTVNQLQASSTDIGEYVLLGDDTQSKQNILASYHPNGNYFTLLDSNSTIDKLYVFTLDNQTQLSGCYYQISNPTLTFSACQPFSGQRSSHSLHTEVNNATPPVSVPLVAGDLTHVTTNSRYAEYLYDYLTLKQQLP